MDAPVDDGSTQNAPMTNATRSGGGEIGAERLLHLADRYAASDVHLKVGRPPMLRIAGELVAPENWAPLDAEDLTRLYREVTSAEQRERFAAATDLDFSCSLDGARLRVNAAVQRGSITMVWHRIPTVVPTLDDLRLPSVCKELVMRPRGLVLVTGPSGSGKSTTLAAMLEYLNERKAVRIVTCEDPIEYVLEDERALITQREMGADTPSPAAALRAALRQDPDVIMVSELGDVETIEAALTAAETGHLVLAGLHTTGAVQTIDRLIDVFPPHLKQQARVVLAGVLEGILSQVLLPTAAGNGRVAAVEVLLATPAIRSLIQEGKTSQIVGVMETSQRLGMRSMDQALVDLYRRANVTVEAISAATANPERLQSLIQGR